MDLYLDLFSQPCRSVFLLAKVLGINFRFQAVDLSAGQQFSEDFGKLSLVRKVPVMKDGSFVLTESVAILQYLVQKTSAEDPWYPADLQQRARVNEYLSWQHQNLRTQGSKVYLLTSLFPIFMGTDVPADKMAAAREELHQSLLLLQDYFLQDKDFITGDRISLADLVAIVEIMQPVGSGLDVFEGRPKLAAWRDRVKAELGAELFDEAHATILNVGSLAQKMKNNPNLEFLKTKYQRLFT